MVIVKTKHSLTFEEIKYIYVSWLLNQYEQRCIDPSEEQLEKQIRQQIEEEFQLKEAKKQEDFQWREKMSEEILKFKFEKHNDQICSLFKRYAQKQNSDELIQLEKVSYILEDLASIQGTVFCTYKEFLETNSYAGFRESSERF